jgi:FdrA protein
MTVQVLIKPNTYFDSVSLMSLSTKANQIEGVEQAIIAMGTEMNKEVIRNVGLMTPEVEEAKTSDLMIVVKTASDELCENAFEAINDLLTKKDTATGSKGEVKYSTLSSAAAGIPDANFAVISVNGAYAAREARKALENDLHVMLFSDNVSVEEEIDLKKLAHEKGLLMMGPDCGTAIINNVGLAFSNAVRKGSIGIVGASGTGSQEVSVRIHEFGGISQLIGTGGRDLSEEVGGMMMLDGIRALDADEETKVIVLVSKPPAASVEDKICEQIKKCSKPVVVWFIGGNEEKVTAAGGHFAKMSKEAALKAVLLTGADESKINKKALNIPLINEVRSKLKPEQKYIRGLFCGGTLCDEAMYAAMDKFENVYSNIQKNPHYRLKDINVSQEHTFIDFGDDEFTKGKPHPMIDPSTRIERFKQEANDPSVGVIVMDFVLGFGSHEDPVGVMMPAIIEAKQQAEQEGRHLEILGYILGTELDPQNYQEQIDKLIAAGATHASSSQNAGLLAREFVVKGE